MGWVHVGRPFWAVRSCKTARKGRPASSFPASQTCLNRISTTDGRTRDGKSCGLVTVKSGDHDEEAAMAPEASAIFVRLATDTDGDCGRRRRPRTGASGFQQ